jgi:hypothetical protein
VNGADHRRQTRDDGRGDKGERWSSEGVHVGGLHLVQQRFDITRRGDAESKAGERYSTTPNNTNTATYSAKRTSPNRPWRPLSLKDAPVA